ncbi:hypothetical protein J4E82_005546 [Alternaria postmessia]|nr:uncharacterized protein J4E82_005546 [Alternaria postmessia]KAI5375835.1 hypothetical protein J4E82_005546 [Alternaria postmessia]
MLNAFEVHRDDRADSTTSHATIIKFTKASNAIIVVDLDIVMLAAQLLLSARTFYEVILCVHPMNHERLVTLTLGAGYLGKGKQRADPPQASRGPLN